MKPVRKTACFLFIFFLIFPLFADIVPDEDILNETQPDMIAPERSGEDSPPAIRLFFFEELFIFDNILSFYESIMNEENLSGEDTFLDEETLLSEEILPSEEINLDEGFFPEEKSLLAEETPSDEETLLAEETLPGEDTFPEDETYLSEEIFPDDEILLAEEDYYDDEALFFEASPLVFESPVFELRSLETIFPNLSQSEKTSVMSNDGLRRSFTKNEFPAIIPNRDLGIDLYGSVVKKNPSHIIEALVVVPYYERELDLLDVYNALGRIENIKNQTTSISGKESYIFTESTRIESARNRKTISDPSPSVTLPFSETMYLRLKEVYLGNLYLRGDMSISRYGITYSMTNFTDVRYFLIPIMKTERFITIIYLEPVKEGVLIYSMAGFYLPGFIADRISLTPNINRRIRIFVKWITEGLRK